ncbi:MAG: glycosyl hydrolase [Bdellovibrio sp. CG10_big_fil_rev_8_21_14_0_10_47_8]|nr:MAG: glycosyl hydrolase [Bdellovibrio sp. CG10_big_fil_rev_8_21_14_0_10_47_8]
MKKNIPSEQHQQKNQSQHQYQMGIIGNCSFNALVDQHANIKWLCWPRFDSSFIFGSLLDEKKGGEYSISPADETYTSKQSYIVNTNVLVTRFESEEGVFEVTDFAPRFLLNERIHRPLMLFRKVRKISGSPRAIVKCRAVGSYGEMEADVQLGSHHIRYMNLEAPVRLTTNASLTYIQQQRPFAIAEDLYFVLSWGIPLEGPLLTTFEDFLTRTIKYWQTWVERCTLPQLFQKEVIRSALTLKLHQFEDTGAIIASCSTSLPEIPGEHRNWDYRFCWLRDTYYTLHALNSLGHFEEMEKYAHFIENLNIESLTALQPVYCIDGTANMTERELPLGGYLNNQPVRVGNEAATQIQHDAYGQILLALFNLHTDVRLVERRRLSEQSLESLLGYIEKTIDTPDNGVWEFQGKTSVHSYSLLFHWAGSAACRKIAKHIKNEDLAKRADICIAKTIALLEKCYDAERGVYTQAIGSKDLDASLLQMITLGYFHGQKKNKAVSHLRAIQKDLEITPGFLLRYRHPDKFGEQKSAFLVCSFWYIEALASLDFIDEATALFEKVLKTQNALGLMSEDFDVDSSSQWGNFPQTYSHVGLINCAFALDKASRKPAFL